MKKESAMEAKLSEIRKELEDEKRTWQCEIHSEKLADNIVKEHYARGRVNGIEVAEQILTKLKADVERLRGKCEWTESEDYPCQTSCGHEFEFIYDSISENNFKFCPFCGGEIAARALDETK